MKKIIFLFLSMFMISQFHYSCKTSYYSSPDEFDGKQVTLSEGGGFSGQTTQTIILENGQVFVRTIFPESLKESKRLAKKTTSEIFKRLESLKTGQVSFINPGNMSYSLMLKSKDEKYELIWGDPGFSVPQEVHSCYQYIKSQIKAN